MRVLFTTYPDKSIMHPMVPLAWALRTAGHDVQMAVQPGFVDEVTAAGLTAVPVGRNRGTGRLAELNPERTEAERAGLPVPYAAATDAAAADWTEMTEGYETLLARWHKLDNFPMIAGLVEYARCWRPDLIVWEATTYAGAIAAKACGAAHARQLWSIDVFGVTRQTYLSRTADQPPGRQADPLADWLAGYGSKYDFEYTEDMTCGQFTIDQLPPSLRMHADLDYLSVQHIPYGGRAVVPRWLWTPPQRPRVALTLGITATDLFAGYAVDMQEILDALADLDIEIIATVADTARQRLTRIPDNATIVPYVPLHALAPTCAAVINHAGPGTLLTTARYGVPQLTVPWDFDEPELARRSAAHGAALMIRADHATGQAVRDALLRLLHERGFRERAAALRDEIRALPTPNELVPQLEELAAKHRTDA